MALQMRPLGQEHVPALVKIYRAAFRDQPPSRAMYVGVDEEQFLDHQRNRFARELQERNTHALGAFDNATGELIAFAIWCLEDEISHEQQKGKEKSGQQGHAYGIPGANSAALDRFFPVYTASEKRVMGEKTFWRKCCSHCSKHQTPTC